MTFLGDYRFSGNGMSIDGTVYDRRDDRLEAAELLGRLLPDGRPDGRRDSPGAVDPLIAPISPRRNRSAAPTGAKAWRR